MLFCLRRRVEFREIPSVKFRFSLHFSIHKKKKKPICRWSKMPLVLARTHTSFIIGAKCHDNFGVSI